MIEFTTDQLKQHMDNAAGLLEQANVSKNTVRMLRSVFDPRNLARTTSAIENFIHDFIDERPIDLEKWLWLKTETQRKFDTPSDEQILPATSALLDSYEEQAKEMGVDRRNILCAASELCFVYCAIESAKIDKAEIKTSTVDRTME